jgi:glycosyltransferase involved in cell wall biosynthesis
MLKGRDIVVIGLQPWYYEIGSNCKNIATMLAQQNRVLYVNLPINRKTFYSKDENPGIREHISIIKEKGNQIKTIAENFWQFYPVSVVESINWLPSTKAFKWMNAVNNKRFARDIQNAVRQLGFSDYILFNDNDIFNGYDLKNLLSPSLYVYYCRDYLRGNPYWKKHSDTLEPELIRYADLVVANSGFLAEYCAQFNPDSYYIGQGCNLELFDPQKVNEIPQDVKAVRHPVIGYVGAIIATRLDENIIKLIATSHNNWNVVLVGPEDETFKKSSLHDLPNILFTGRKDLSELPAYVKSFDVCINPQLVNMLTIGNYPLKVDEYLAMGKPVVATRTRTMELFSEYTYLADKPEEYLTLIEKALDEDSPERSRQRIAFAKTHTWHNSVEELSRLVVQMEIKKQAGKRPVS